MSIQIYELCGAEPTNLFSPHCWKTKMSLAHKGLEYETIPTPFTQVATVEDGTSRRVPVIRDEETVVEESLEIALYLDEKYPERPNLFDGEGSKALTSLIVNWSQTQVHPAVVKLCLLDIHSGLAPTDQAFFRQSREKLFGMTLEDFDAQQSKSNEGLVAALLPLELMLKQQAFIGGSSPLFADYVVFGPLQWLRTSTTRDVMPKDSRVAEWFDRLLDMHEGLGRNAQIKFAA